MSEFSYTYLHQASKHQPQIYVKNRTGPHQSADIHIGICFPLFLSFLLPTLSSCFFFIMFLFIPVTFLTVTFFPPHCYFFPVTFFLLLFFRGKIVTFFLFLYLHPNCYLFSCYFFSYPKLLLFFLLPFFLLLSFRAPCTQGGRLYWTLPGDPVPGIRVTLCHSRN